MCVQLYKYNTIIFQWVSPVFLKPGENTNTAATIPLMGKWFTPFEVLRMITHDNGELLAFSGKRSPYREGKLGVLEEGAYADMILVDGNPLSNLQLMEDYKKNFVLIMKNGVVYKLSLIHISEPTRPY